jgi:phospholipase C
MRKHDSITRLGSNSRFLRWLNRGVTLGALLATSGVLIALNVQPIYGIDAINQYVDENPDKVLTFTAHAHSAGIPIEHFIFIIQENHSFDNYFGTYPGANDFPPGTLLADYPGGASTSRTKARNQDSHRTRLAARLVMLSSRMGQRSNGWISLGRISARLQLLW